MDYYLDIIFDWFILFWILANSANLAMYDYSKGNKNSTNVNSINDYLEIAFTLVFVLEAILKITGMGFVMHK